MGVRLSQWKLLLLLYPAGSLRMAEICVMFSAHMGKPLLSPLHCGLGAFRAHPSCSGDPSQ